MTAEPAVNAKTGLRLNLGCGVNHHEGYTNVDKAGWCNPDVQLDLEHFPWPWEDNTVEEIVLNHVLEHLGADVNVYRQIWQEIYRVCQHDARVFVVIPHPRHEHFIGDPTHVRAIHQLQFALLSKPNCDKWVEAKVANTPLAHYWDVDFETLEVQLIPDSRWKDFRTTEEEQTIQNLAYDADTIMGVCQEIRAVLKVVKE